MRSTHRICATLTSMAFACLSDGPAFATMPGQNGVLTFSRLAPGDLTGQVAVAEAEEDADVTILTSEGLLNADSIFSPDGNCILFYSERDGGDQEVYAMDVDGENQTRLTVYPAFDYDAVYSPEGDKVAFVSNRDGDYEIYTFDLSTGATVQLTKNSVTDFTPAWSPDGTLIAFSSQRDGNFEIYTMTPTGADQTRLTDDPAFDIYPDFSPDSQTIIFATERQGTIGRDIWTMDADGSNESALITQAGSDSDPVFSPDATMIAFSCGNHICIAKADGSEIVTVTTADLVSDRGPDWQPLPVKVTPSLCPTIAPKVCGDANSDGTVKSTDALVILKKGVGQTVVCPHIRCDVDDSGTVVSSDALRALRFSVGQSVTLDCPDVEPLL